MPHNVFGIENVRGFAAFHYPPLMKFKDSDLVQLRNAPRIFSDAVLAIAIF